MCARVVCVCIGVLEFGSTRTLSGYLHSARQQLTKHVVVHDVSSRSKTLPSTAQPTVDSSNTATELAPTFNQTRDISLKKAYPDNCHARQLNVTTTIATLMTTTPSPATIAPAPVTTTLNSCDHIVSNDSCAIHQLPTMIRHRPLTYHNKKLNVSCVELALMLEI